MKQSAAVFFLFTFVLSIISCKKVQDDKIPPVISLTGENPVYWFSYCDYEDEGFRVSDDLTDSVDMVFRIDSGGIFNADTGKFLITYYATDADSNTASVTRKIIKILFDNSYFKNTEFTAKHAELPLNTNTFTSTIHSQLLYDNFVLLKNFHGLGEDFSPVIQFDSAGNLNIDYSLDDITIKGNGTMNCNTSGFLLNYKIKTPAYSDTLRFKATFTRR